MNPKTTEPVHTHATGLKGWVQTIFHLGGHTHMRQTIQDPMLSTNAGIRTVWLALATLAATTLIQIVIVWLSGSVALLADTIHNLGDSLNSIPLLIAFYLARRAATRRYTYGYGRAEDVAGVVIVLTIAFSAVVILWESAQKFLNPQPMQHIPWVMTAAVIGFLGNEGVALLQIRVGRKIGSQAMLADGIHARIDGITSLAVLGAAIGTWLGLPILDPLIGLAIGIVIVFIAKDAAVGVWHRLMDAVDPVVTDQIEQYAGDVKGVAEVRSVQARWIGHELHAEVSVLAEANADNVVHLVQQSLLGRVAYLTHVLVQVELVGSVEPAVASPIALATDILPPRYQDPNIKVSSAPMGAAALKYDNEGKAAWNEVWTGYCELALAGGPPHRGSLLEPVDPASITAEPEKYAWVVDEIERGLKMVTGLKPHSSDVLGWVGLKCKSEEMAVWLVRAITVENVSVRREGDVLFFPAGPHFRLEREIKNVVTVVAKTNHYWTEHAQSHEAADV